MPSTGLKLATVASAWLAVLLASASLAASGDDAAGVAGGGSGGSVRRPSRTGSGCAGAEDIDIYQRQATPLPSGVPAYKVAVTNRCTGDGDGDDQYCAIAGIHVRCGWFSSVSLVDPRKFRRLGHDDCLVNDGRPLLAGETVSFDYANSFPYELSVRAATCFVGPTTTSAPAPSPPSAAHGNR